MTGLAGRYRRLIDLRRQDDRTAVGWMEDDFHHFGVTVVHDGGVVVDVRAMAVRYPWTTCPGATEPLKALVGKPLVSRSSDIGGLIDMRVQCTHLFDLAGLVLAHAARGGDHRRYEVTVLDRAVTRLGADGIRPEGFGPTVVSLRQDGVEVTRWDLDDRTIIAPPACAGRSLERGFRAWTEAMPEAEAEHATILRRAIMVANGRTVDLDRYPAAAGLDMPPVCHTYQPERKAVALRMRNSIRDFSPSADGMLSEVDGAP